MTMTTRRLNAFIDDLVAGRRPRGFRADAEDTEIVRVAIALRGQRPGDATPDPTFVASLRQELRDVSDSTQVTEIKASKWHRGRVALVGIAAALAVVGGTVAITETTTRGSVQQSAAPVPHGQGLRTATFETSAGQVRGQIVVYRGHPSWVFMNVEVPHESGPMRCELHLTNGVVVAAGTVELHDGRGELAKTIHVNGRQLRTATISTSSGVVLASATFA